MKELIQNARKTETELTVQGFHIDRYGHVNNARYLEFLEMGRWDFIDTHLDKEIAAQKGWQFTIVRIDIRYKKACFFDDELIVETADYELGNVKFVLKQKVLLKATRQVAAEALVSFVLFDAPNQRPLRLVKDVRGFLLGENGDE